MSPSSPFSKIPAEIRVKIFKLLSINDRLVGDLSFRDPKLRSVSPENLVVTVRDGPYDVHPGILQCYRLFNQEAKPILYAQGFLTTIGNTFIFPHPPISPEQNPYLYPDHRIGTSQTSPIPVLAPIIQPEELKKPLSHHAWTFIETIKGIRIDWEWPSPDTLCSLIAHFTNLREVDIDLHAGDEPSWDELHAAIDTYMDTVKPGDLAEWVAPDGLPGM